MVIKDEFGYIVKPRALRKALLKELKRGDFVITGHLIPDLLKDGEVDFIVVLRLSPYELIKRYRDRDYDEVKTRKNLTVEALDLILINALKRFGRRRVTEIDTTGKSPEQVAEEVIAAYRNKRRRIGIVDWLSLIGNPDDIRRFLI